MSREPVEIVGYWIRANEKDTKRSSIVRNNRELYKEQVEMFGRGENSILLRNGDSIFRRLFLLLINARVTANHRKIASTAIKKKLISVDTTGSRNTIYTRYKDIIL